MKNKSTYIDNAMRLISDASGALAYLASTHVEDKVIRDRMLENIKKLDLANGKLRHVWIDLLTEGRTWK